MFSLFAYFARVRSRRVRARSDSDDALREVSACGVSEIPDKAFFVVTLSGKTKKTTFGFGKIRAIFCEGFSLSVAKAPDKVTTMPPNGVAFFVGT